VADGTWAKVNPLPSTGTSSIRAIARKCFIASRGDQRTASSYSNRVITPS
jgi:hypothetical protein